MDTYKIHGTPSVDTQIEQLKQRITTVIEEITRTRFRLVLWAEVERWVLWRDVQEGHVELY